MDEINIAAPDRTRQLNRPFSIVRIRTAFERSARGNGPTADDNAGARLGNQSSR